jgi:hypothetical protein
MQFAVARTHYITLLSNLIFKFFQGKEMAGAKERDYILRKYDIRGGGSPMVL